MENKFDTHHLLWTRNEWNRPNARKLRNHWYCKVTIPTKTLHEMIHWQIKSIPPPNEALCKEAFIQLEFLEAFGVIGKEDSIFKKLDVLISCLDTGDSETVKALKRQKAVAQFWVNL